MRYLTAFSNGLARIEAIALAICLITMLSVAFFQVIMRNIYGIGYVWADILVRVLVLWVGLLGATVATHEGRHLTIEVVTKFLPAQVTRALRVFVNCFALTVCLFLTNAAVKYIKLQQATSTGQGLLGMPEWVSEAIVPIAFILISFHFFVLIIIGIVDIIKGTDVAAPHQEGL